jgi:glycosyltransferase involved in cell wall biosynthesis
MNLQDIRQLRRLILSGGYDLVHCHGTWDHALAFWALQRLRDRVPLVRTDHGGRIYRPGLLSRSFYGYPMTDHLIVLTDRFAVLAVDRLKLSPDRVTSVRGSVDVDHFRPRVRSEPGRRHFGLRPDDVAIGIVARVQRHRRFEVLVRAALYVAWQDSRVKFLVLGRGTHKEELLDRPVVEMGLQDTIIPLGYRTHDYMQTLATFDAGLMLVPGSDGSCRAALEMASMGLPLIVARRGALPDIVEDGRTGIVVEDSPANLARAMLTVAENARRREVWGRRGRARMRQYFTPEREADEVAAVYRRVLSRL